MKREKDEKLYRRNFALNYLKNIINNRENKEIYECGENKKIRNLE